MKLETIRRLIAEYEDLLVRIPTLAQAQEPFEKDVCWSNSGLSQSTLVAVIKVGVAEVLKRSEARVIELQKTLNIEQ